MRWFRNLFGETQKEPIYLYNTLHATREQFRPLSGNRVKMYNCGPTVYGPQHIGNYSMFVFVDTLRRVLEYNGYKLKQVINFTDIGHLTGDNEGDADAGEDRMTRGLEREGLALTLENMRAMGERYGALFLADLKKLNIEITGVSFPRASDYIAAQIAMAKTLEEKGYAYPASKGVYFDTSRFSAYGELGNINLAGLRSGARIAVDQEKKNPTDFLLWKFDKKMGWESPWGKGFPGWHLECSAIARAILGEQLDIHTGGIEHIPIHHNNEIAQSESATGRKPFSRFWLHRAHLQIEGAKIAKSVGNTIYLAELEERGFSPLSFRYLLLGAHYRTAANFTWEALKGAQSALDRLYNLYAIFASEQTARHTQHSGSYERSFLKAVNDDLDTPAALAIMWEMLRDESVSTAEKLGMLDSFDRVFGLNIAEGSKTHRGVDATELPADAAALLQEREDMRKNKMWDKADQLRREIEGMGFALEDTSDGPRISKIEKRL